MEKAVDVKTVEVPVYYTKAEVEAAGFNLRELMVAYACEKAHDLIRAEPKDTAIDIVIRIRCL